MIEREIAQVVANVARLTLAELPIGWGLMKDKRVVMHIFTKVMPKLDLPTLPFHTVNALRDSAAAGLEARAVFASPEGIFVQKIGHPVIDGWIGIENNQLSVTFGQIKTGNRFYPEAVEPMQMIAQSRKEWFQ